MPFSLFFARRLTDLVLSRTSVGLILIQRDDTATHARTRRSVAAGVLACPHGFSGDAVADSATQRPEKP
jgi:hypothetical protein